MRWVLGALGSGFLGCWKGSLDHHGRWLGAALSRAWAAGEKPWDAARCLVMGGGWAVGCSARLACQPGGDRKLGRAAAKPEAR